MVAVRAARSEDAAAIAAIYAPHVLTGSASFETEPPDARAICGRLEASSGLYPWLVATGDQTDSILGYAYATSFNAREAYRWTVETTVYVADAAQRQGVGRLLCDTLVRTLRAQCFTQAIARIALPNDASIALHEAIGFHHVGVTRAVGYKHNRWIDVGLWQRRLHQPGSPPNEPHRFTDIGIVRG